MEVKIIGWDSLQSVLKGGQSVHRNFDFAIPPPFYFCTKVSRAILEQELNLKREDAHRGWWSRMTGDA